MGSSIIRAIILCCFFMLLCIFYIYMYVKYQKHVDAKYDTIFRTVHIEYIYKVIMFQPIIGEKVLKYNFKEEGKAAFFKLRFLLYKDYINLRIRNNYDSDSKETIFKDNDGTIVASIKLEKELYNKDVIITYRRQENESYTAFLNRIEDYDGVDVQVEHAKNESTT